METEGRAGPSLPPLGATIPGHILVGPHPRRHTAAESRCGGMGRMFRSPAVLLGVHLIHCLLTREVFARAGLSGRTYGRDPDGFRYWGAVSTYVALAAAP